jgi:hypothetical protein
VTAPGESPREPGALALARPAKPRGRLARWLLGDAGQHRHATHPWYLVLWLTGVDYFSTLGYQPGIALLAAGALSPLATGLLVVVTLIGALPIYAQVASRSYAGQGSIAMLESLLPGWFGKLLVLVMLGFAATDFVITITLSAADATQHAIENPFLHEHLGDARLPLTVALIALLAAVFLKGFTEAIGVAAMVAVPYLLLNLVVLIRGLFEIAARPGIIGEWRSSLFTQHGDPVGLLVVSALIFPKLALGLSGFETGVSVMPLVRGESAGGGVPRARIAATRRLLAAAALIMCFYLLLSSFVTTLLVPEEVYAEDGEAAGRALAWLAHGLLGHGFGSVYDVATLLILWFAGASAMAGLLNLIPRYLPRFGMAPGWVAHRRPLVIVILVICVIVTWIFDADVEAQGGAYATGVLALILSAAVAVALSLTREGKRLLGGYFWIMSAVFAYTLLENIHERPDGLIISSVFIGIVLLLSAVSRYLRATELRVTEITFADEESARLWKEMTGKKVNLVPLTQADPAARLRKKEEIDRHYDIHHPYAFVHVRLLDNRSEFLAPVSVCVRKEGADYSIEATGAVAIANTIAYFSELLDPVGIFLGLTRKSLMTQSLRYLLWGEGETGLMVYQILLRWWDWTPGDDVRPYIFLMSEDSAAAAL